MYCLITDKDGDLDFRRVDDAADMEEIARDVADNGGHAQYFKTLEEGARAIAARTHEDIDTVLSRLSIFR